MESELGDFITALNFIFGSFVAYFIFILCTLKLKTKPLNKPLWWWSMCLLLALLAFDELYMIHEYLGSQMGFKDTLIFLFYGVLLGVLLLFNLKETFTKNTFFFLVLFTVCTIFSQVADFLYTEGTVVLLGRVISYEQFLESFGALFLSCAVVTIAIRELINKDGHIDDTSQ
ncbi:hypothetical protein RI844_14820 [Thalassotalea fonticola]|uniref:Lycopene cyclase domain-containing protein n=1 Tax=Thalassotalea fonticola TaxID=3065649 RepID=A0ABZ0GLI8_9GAMM|nr:hypothetical protein RI844_14820 [Colwelliaceae bacterium S1-1]